MCNSIIKIPAMNFKTRIFWLVFAAYWCGGGGDLVEKYETDVGNKDNFKSTYLTPTEGISMTPSNENFQETCSSGDFLCLTMATNDKFGLEAIKSLHQQLDDDANGNVDVTETGDFLRQDLKIDSGYEKRQKAFHQNDDMHISVKELWEAWIRSEVHNWTVEQTVEWLTTCVDLPQYKPNFIHHRVTGATLPRLAVNNMHYLSVLGIKDPIHKQKISLKAMDVVLFGPPKDSHHWKDLVLIVLIIGVGIGFWYGYQQNKRFKNHVNRMCKDMEGLQNAEQALENLQRELEEARQAQEHVVTEKQNLEKRLQETEADSTTLHNSYSDLEVSQLKAEIEMLRTELQIAEGELKDRCWSPPHGLQQWLQLTHEIENKAYIKKKLAAEKQLQHAREACEKLRKKRSSLVGAFVSTHGKSIDDVDRTIVEARTSLNEVTQELQERVHRWKQIELLCGFNIVNNNGLQTLENILYRNINGRAFGLRGRMSSQDDLDDDSSSLYSPSAGHADSGLQHSSWKEADSSGSEASKQDEDFDVRQSTTSVNFIVGGEVTNWPEDTAVLKHVRVSSQPPNIRSISNSNITSVNNNKTSMVRSYSQDTNIAQPDASLASPKSSFSDTSLDHVEKKKSQKIGRIRTQTIKEQPSVSNEDICSTDSSVMEEEIKRKKKKFPFKFGKTKLDKLD